jgi:uncharacterized protein YndB with AHSA1/START domain
MATASSTASSPDREIVLSRVFAAPRELVWKAFTDSGQLAHWWGPRGFTTRTHRMDVKPGGAWRFVMIGPDGREYENLITYLEVAAPERLRYKHGGDKDVEPVNFEVTVTFAKEDGAADRTRVTMRSVFPSKNARDFVAREYNAIEGGKQTLARLAEQLGGGAASSADPLDRPFVVTRVFKAPRQLVWDAWTQREHLMRWMGPKGTTIAHATLDLRPGGLFHYGMQAPDGKLMWGKWVFREIAPPDRLVVVVSFSDEQAGITRHPLAADWPLETLSTVTFAEHAGIGGGTTVVLQWLPLNATETERRLFAASHAGMEQGWGGTMEQLAAYLASRVGPRGTGASA